MSEWREPGAFTVQSERIWIKNSKDGVGFLKINEPLFSTRYGGAQFYWTTLVLQW